MITGRFHLDWRVLGLCFLPAVGAARGDALQIEGRRPMDNIRITGVHAGVLAYRLPDGQETTQELAQVEWIAFNRWPLFNLAEKQRTAGEFRLAANTYEKVLDVLHQQSGAARPVQPADWAREDLALLVRCRMIEAYDRSNRFDLAVQSYLDVVRRMPEVTRSLRPGSIPPPQSSFLRAARAHVEQAVARSRDEDFRSQMREWLHAWPDPAASKTESGADAATGNDEASFHGRGRGPADNAPGWAFHQALENVAAHIAEENYLEALSRLDELRRQWRQRPAVWYYWRGRALQGRASSLPGEDRRTTLILGGLAYLRVVIHFPEDERAPESLYRAGAICDELGIRERAATLWSDLRQRWPEASPWSRMAAEELERTGAE